MNTQGRLDISLTRQSSNPDLLKCAIHSSRPLIASHLFSNKTIEYTIDTIPLVFSICALAQSTALVRAIEGATGKPACHNIETHREALVTLESLREQALRILIDWPAYIGEKPDPTQLSKTTFSINQLIQLLEPKKSLSIKPIVTTLTSNHKAAWKLLSKQLSETFYSTPSQDWVAGICTDESSVNCGPNKCTTQAHRFINWLNLQKWKHDGSSDTPHLPAIDDHELALKLHSAEEAFTAHPQWANRSYELSWLSRQQSDNSSDISAMSRNLSKQHGNGIYTRMLARLLEVARLIEQLDRYFIENKQLIAPLSSHAGLAHSNAARGRLTHCVEVERFRISKLTILAPTEWNFHPQGVAAQSLCQLGSRPNTSKNDIAKRAKLMIHAIDPCVGYQLNLSFDKSHNGVLH